MSPTNYRTSACNMLADVTCSICLQLYVAPKIMPNCPHTFCQSCLEQLPRELGYQNSIRCPQCRTLNVLGQAEIKDLQTNLIAQNIVEKMQMQTKLSQQLINSTNPDNADVCIHSLFLPEGRQKCRHCDKDFCYSCKFHHMDRIKSQILQISTEMPRHNGTVWNSAAEELNEIVATKLRRDLETVEAQLENISSAMQKALTSVRQKVAAIRASSSKLVSDETAKLQTALGKLSKMPDLPQLEHRKHKVVSESIFKQDLDDVANLYLDMVRYNQAAGELQKASNMLEAPFLKFEEVPILRQLVAELETMELGVLKVNAAGGSKIFNDLPDPAPKKEPANHREVLSNSNNSRRLSLFGIAKNWLTSSTSRISAPEQPIQISHQSRVSAVAPVANTSPSSGIRRTVKIITLHGLKLFAVLHDENQITLFNAAKEVKGSFAIQTPDDLFRFEIETIASDDRHNVIFFVCQTISEDDGELSRRIYYLRVSQTSETLEIQPTLFAVGSEDESFKGGLLISWKMRWLLTTDGNSVVAYSLENRPGELARRIRSWKLGPEPFLYGIDDSADYDDESVNIVGLVMSCRGQLGTFPIMVGEGVSEQTQLKPIVWTYTGQSDGQVVRLSDPCCMYYWRRKALIEHNDHIFIFKGDDLLNRRPAVVQSFSSTALTAGSSLCDFSGMAAGRCDEDNKLYCAALYLDPSYDDFQLERDIVLASFTSNRR